MSLIFGSSVPAEAYALSRAIAAKRLRKLASKIYTDDLKSLPEEIVRSHRFEIVAHFYPNAVISHRSAIYGGNLSPGNRFHVTVQGSPITSRPLPGMEIRIWPGPGPQPEDHLQHTVAGQIHMACRARAVLENLQPSRARGDQGESKNLSRPDLEIWLDTQVRRLGAAELHSLLAEARPLAARVGWPDSLTHLETLIANLEGRGNIAHLRSPVAIARAQGDPYDPDRITLFTALQARLAAETFQNLPSPPAAERSNRAFWESYFSNYIEGTKFTVEEAQSIVLASDPRRIAQQRPKDAHDILETYRLIFDDNICREVPSSAAGFFDVLKRRHARMMASRPEVEPGVFKKRANQIGTKQLVSPALVEGTLRRVWPMIQTLKDPVSRALMVHFALAEIHPFSDGNGRISRLSMNAELDAAGRMRILIPNSYRNDYLTVLDALTRSANLEPYIAFGHRLLQINQAVSYATQDLTYAHFKTTGALEVEDTALGLNLAALSQK